MTLDDQIADLGMTGELADVLTRVLKERAVETGREAGYVSIRPTGRHIAAYFNRKFVDVAVDPHTSREIASRLPGTSVITKTTATHYLRIPDGCVATDAVVDLVTTAVDWRERGHQWSGSWSGGASADLAGETCQSCYLEIAKNGTCGCE